MVERTVALLGRKLVAWKVALKAVLKVGKLAQMLVDLTGHSSAGTTAVTMVFQ